MLLPDTETLGDFTISRILIVISRSILYNTYMYAGFPGTDPDIIKVLIAC